ncbi:hypothetical protein T310_10305, partial [Rasamsonia emersonii CBS 393.64]
KYYFCLYVCTYTHGVQPIVYCIHYLGRYINVAVSWLQIQKYIYSSKGKKKKGMHGYTIDPIPYPNPVNYSGQCKNAFQDMTSSVVLSDECDRNCFSFLSSFSFFVFFFVE